MRAARALELNHRRLSRYGMNVRRLARVRKIRILCREDDAESVAASGRQAIGKR